MLNSALEKYYLIRSHLNDSQKIFNRSANLYKEGHRYYLRTIDRHLAFINIKTYPSKKAFRQVLPQGNRIKRIERRMGK